MAESEMVVLRGGVLVSIEAISFALDLESRGVRLEVDGADLLFSPRDRVTDEDKQRLRALKPHLTAIVRYVDSVQ